MTALHAQQSGSPLSSFSKTLNYLNAKNTMWGTLELNIAIPFCFNFEVSIRSREDETGKPFKRLHRMFTPCEPS